MYPIEQIVKHRKPMLLIDKLINFDEESARVSVAINENSLFYSEQIRGVPCHIGIEYMAQCVAAYAGANDCHNNIEIRIGFLLGSRKYNPKVEFFEVGQSLIVSAERIIKDDAGLSVFECTIYNNEETQLLAEARINVYQPDDQDALITDKE